MIELSNLVALHDDKRAIHRHKRILEELFYLCINKSFLTTIAEARLTIKDLLEENEIALPCNQETALYIKKHLSLNSDYQSLLDQISDKHKYYHPSFTRNYRQIGTDVVTFSHFNILENIIFFNNPIPSENPLDYFHNRSGFMEIANDEIMGPVVRIQFDLGTTKGEMINIIEKDFPEIKELMQKNFNMPKTQYRADESLTIKEFIHRYWVWQESDMDIAIRLENEGLLSSEVTEDHIKKYRQRMNIDTARFQGED